MGWWNVQYCHKDEIIQFHRQADGTLDPKWSVGKYSPQVERTSFDNVPRGYYHSYFYTHGQVRKVDIGHTNSSSSGDVNLTVVL